MNFAHRIKKYLIFPLLIGLFLTINARADGDVDFGFNASAQFRANGPVHVIMPQSDGKILVGGSFTVVNGVAANSIVRLNADGSVDTSFSATNFLKLVTIYAIAVQPDGKILVGLTATTASTGVKRINADGSLDTTFNDTFFQTSSNIVDIEILPDGKFLAVGGLRLQNVSKSLLRFNPDGTHDASFQFSVNGFVREVLLLPDGKILAGGQYSTNTEGLLLRLNSDGSTDSTFATLALNGAVGDLLLQSDGKIIFSGAFQTVGGQPKRGIARVNSDGIFDSSFNPSNSGTDGTVNDIAFSADGKILIVGTFSLYNNVAKPKVARLNADGTLDASFTASLDPNTTVTSVGSLGTNKILVGYSGGLINPNLPNGISALNADGSLDSTLIYNVSKSALVRKILEQPDGKILVGGNFDLVNNTPRKDLARLNSDGTLDASFNAVVDNVEVTAIGLQPDGKILVALFNNPVMIRRLNSDGSIDLSFTSFVFAMAAINDIVVLPNGKILVGGSSVSGNLGMSRLNADGTPDNTFTYGGVPSTVYKILVEPDGRLLIGRSGGGIQRLTANGAVDGSFNTNTNGGVFDFVKQPDGKIVIVGAFSTVNGSNSGRNIARITPEGVLDPTFTAITDAYVIRVRLQADRKIVIGGQMGFVNGIFRPGLARLNSDGSLDNAFTANANDVVNDFYLSNGKITVAGVFTSINETSRITLGRVNYNEIPPRTPFDFDGDGRTDIVVYRPSNSVWYQLLGQNYQFSSVSFGINEDVLAPADFDGDGKTDVAIFRPSTGAWWYRSSAQGNAFRAVQWGQAGDIPLPSDTDGDGKDDYVLYRPSNNTWYRLTDAGVSFVITFGISGDKPVIGDFDGDGKSDPAVFRPSTGVWWYAASSQNNAFRAVQFGASGDIPSAADYDGDGKTDFALFRPSTGGWYILNSGNNSATIVGFGLSGDKPVAGDYDGDGKADIAVYRPSNGTWYLCRSSAGFAGIQLGTNTDVPIPNAFAQ